MTPNTFVHDRLRTALAPLTDRTWLVVGLALMPVPLTSAFFIVQRLVPGVSLDFSGLPVAYLVYGLATLLTVGVLYAILSPEERTAVFRFERPSIDELGSAVLAFPVGIGVYVLTSRVSGILGYELQGMEYTLTDPVTIAMVVVGAVILAPITEEILYRGLVLGTLLSRGVGVGTAVGAMTALFALIHLPNFGIAGTLFISVWGGLPALLRLRYDNLTGAVCMHMLNNAYAYLVVVGLGWA